MGQSHLIADSNSSAGSGDGRYVQRSERQWGGDVTPAPTLMSNKRIDSPGGNVRLTYQH
jgi:hypothetical protein